MDRRNELAIRDMVAKAERHGWRYCGSNPDGYYVCRTGKDGRKVTLYAHRNSMTLTVSAFRG